MDAPRQPAFRLPAVNSLLDAAPAREMQARHGRPAVLAAVREALSLLRQQWRDGAPGAPFSEPAFFASVGRALADGDLSRLQRVINATGIVLHTNMGRAPLADEAVEAARAVARGYSNLELDLSSGKRGGRGGQIEELLCQLTGAEAAAVVNNCAAAALLALTALAHGGEVIVSRGELVEIGGAFRVPDVIAQGGAKLIEVGTTNKTRLSDYADAITPDTRMLLKVHASNYRMIGFTSAVEVDALAALGRERGLLVMKDLGSGALVDLTQYGLPHEPTVGETIRAGADVVAFSGDKLLGGPQCGILVGTQDAVRALGRHPLFRALRADKMTLAALEATLRLYQDESRLRDSLPVLRMLSQSPDELARRARRLRRGLSQIAGLTVEIAPGLSYSGGGTLPETGIPSRWVRVRPSAMTVECLADSLRRRPPAVMGMLAEGQFVMDVRTVRDDEVREIVQAFAGVLAQ